MALAGAGAGDGVRRKARPTLSDERHLSSGVRNYLRRRLFVFTGENWNGYLADNNELRSDRLIQATCQPKRICIPV